MRILITGAGGLLGGRLCELLSPGNSVVGLTRHHAAPPGVPTLQADLNDEPSLAAVLRSAAPGVVIHCAALADPEVCEREPQRAARENEAATRSLAARCRDLGIRLIACSTDLVFNGRSQFSDEVAAPDPLSIYGRTKLQAERAAMDLIPAAVILRLALIVGRGYGSRLTASESIARRLRKGESASLYRDEWRTPIDPESIASAIETILVRPDLSGMFHIGGSERLSRLELGRRVAGELKLDAALIRSACRAEHQGAPRAEDVSLDITRATRDLRWTPRPLTEALREGRIV